MRQIVVRAPGGPDEMVIARADIPRPGPDDVLIKVAAAGVNHADLLQREGKYPPPSGASPVLGMEVSGTVVACGDDVTEWRAGDAVCALLAGGGYAEYCVAPAPQCLPVPSGVSLIEAAALPEALFTVWTNVFQRGRLVAGETILIHGGTSGVGCMAIQLAHAFGARVVTTAGTDAKCEACRRLGADVALNYRTTDWAADAGTVDVVLDMVGAPYFAKNIGALAIEGRLVGIAFMEGSRAEIDLRPIMTKRLTVTGSTLRPRTVAQKGAIARELREHVWPLLERGQVRPVIDTTFPLADAADAHRRMESGAHVGKIVLTV
ncbi:MAG TPA: NAD(P)H-quinone oxidoreductase [Gemmatimonadaceae bacterium]|jgi:NADPH2:quinone reductase|nr:NAD(P)H-quinone oxidoreductase [Gemmatimonadaceae bacterium]